MQHGRARLPTRNWLALREPVRFQIFPSRAGVLNVSRLRSYEIAKISCLRFETRFQCPIEELLVAEIYSLVHCLSRKTRAESITTIKTAFMPSPVTACMNSPIRCTDLYKR